jgi:hypothetical protein
MDAEKNPETGLPSKLRGANVKKVYITNVTQHIKKSEREEDTLYQHGVFIDG